MVPAHSGSIPNGRKNQCGGMAAIWMESWAVQRQQGAREAYSMREADAQGLVLLAKYAG